MYDRLGIHWASSIPAFLALACVPFPFLFYKYGPAIRMRCKYARAAVEVMERLQRQEESGENSWGKGKRSSNQPKDTEGDKEEVMANGFGAVKREKQEHDLDLEREAS